MEVRIPKIVAIARFRKEVLINSKSLIPTPKPIPMIGPIKGEINMAPMITAVEFTLSPREAIKMAKINTQRLLPLKLIPLRILSMVSASFSLSFEESRMPFR